ncbi:hypothetical protein [Fictibacillus phosphorivorans]|uniref:hypothetical protein n=1 Tax=Fictibacillus phosphorivorans TaxID=1221500 RepID=UPI001293E913|nr:hypothetical protein [Fictibacillus phosphorivorans]MQR93709.1 hypothetical protein [Fictibacillus phosphorivorans]
MLKKSPLIPKKDGQLLEYETWDAHTPENHWEFYDGKPFNPYNTYEAERLMIALIYYCGLNRLIELLPGQSKEELFKLLQSEMKDK